MVVSCGVAKLLGNLHSEVDELQNNVGRKENQHRTFIPIDGAIMTIAIAETDNRGVDVSKDAIITLHGELVRSNDGLL